MTFPVYIPLGPWRIHPHPFFETLAYLLAFRLYLLLRKRYGDPISDSVRWSVIAAAAAGAAVGSKLLFWLEEPAATLRHLHDPAFIMGGKTIVGGLLGGLIAVELVKSWLGERHPTGDLFAVPLAFGIAIGRIGCFLTGLADNTYGTVTTLPWGVDFGDGVRRHPTQLYETLFLLFLMAFLFSLLRPETDSPLRQGDIFRIFMVSYLFFRLLCDFLKPYPPIAFGLCSLQWACLLGLLYYARHVGRWYRIARAPQLSRLRAPQEAA